MYICRYTHRERKREEERERQIERERQRATVTIGWQLEVLTPVVADLPEAPAAVSLKMDPKKKVKAVAERAMTSMASLWLQVSWESHTAMNK